MAEKCVNVVVQLYSYIAEEYYHVVICTCFKRVKIACTFILFLYACTINKTLT